MTPPLESGWASWWLKQQIQWDVGCCCASFCTQTLKDRKRLLGHPFFKPSLHVVRKPKKLCGKAHMERDWGQIMASTDLLATWISHVGIASSSFSRTAPAATVWYRDKPSCWALFTLQIQQQHKWLLLSETTEFWSHSLYSNRHPGQRASPFSTLFCAEAMPRLCNSLMAEPFRQGPAGISKTHDVLGTRVLVSSQFFSPANAIV